MARSFDYSAPAELFAPKGRPGMRQPVAYRRFPSAAAAIRFAVEELSQAGLAAAILEVNEDRFDHVGIRQLYEDTEISVAAAHKTARLNLAKNTGSAHTIGTGRSRLWARTWTDGKVNHRADYEHDNLS